MIRINGEKGLIIWRIYLRERKDQTKYNIAIPIDLKKKKTASCIRWNKIVWVFCLFAFKLRMGLER